VCTYTPNKKNSVLINLANGAKIPALEAFNFQFSNVMNPNTTFPT